MLIPYWHGYALVDILLTFNALSWEARLKLGSQMGISVRRKCIEGYKLAYDSKVIVVQ